ncbi:hypothetical protein PG987_010330 [Apiospora arundinis]
MFDPNCEENLISRRFLEHVLGRTIEHVPSGYDIVRMVFKITGQEQRFETLHRVSNKPCFDKIVFSRCRSSMGASKQSPLELHIVNGDVLSSSCTCCMEPICRVGDLNCVDQYSWYDVSLTNTHHFPSTSDLTRIAEPASNTEPPQPPEQIQTFNTIRNTYTLTSLRPHSPDGMLLEDGESCGSGNGVVSITAGPDSDTESEPRSPQHLTEDTSKLGSSFLECEGDWQLAMGEERQVQSDTTRTRDKQRSTHSLSLSKHNGRVLAIAVPDDYWTYDEEAGNYYHIDEEEDGTETKIWYPEEFLAAHKEDEIETQEYIWHRQSDGISTLANDASGCSIHAE